MPIDTIDQTRWWEDARSPVLNVPTGTSVDGRSRGPRVKKASWTVKYHMRQYPVLESSGGTYTPQKRMIPKQCIALQLPSGKAASKSVSG
jgi:hypothetical protein